MPSTDVVLALDRFVNVLISEQCNHDRHLRGFLFSATSDLGKEVKAIYRLIFKEWNKDKLNGKWTISHTYIPFSKDYVLEIQRDTKDTSLIKCSTPLGDTVYIYFSGPLMERNQSFAEYAFFKPVDTPEDRKAFLISLINRTRTPS